MWLLYGSEFIAPKKTVRAKKALRVINSLSYKSHAEEYLKNVQLLRVEEYLKNVQLLRVEEYLKNV